MLRPALCAHRRCRLSGNHRPSAGPITVIDAVRSATKSPWPGKKGSAAAGFRQASEPVAWYGPIVMNTQDQLKQALKELEKEHS
jgi:hypothetical protein